MAQGTPSDDNLPDFGDYQRDRVGSMQEVIDKINHFETALADLKQRYEQYFNGIVHLPPDKFHASMKMEIRNLRNLPFKNSAVTYKLMAVENKYKTLNTYWQRILREKENGTFHKDVFKAELRQRAAFEDQFAATDKGKSEKGLQALFKSYKDAIEKVTGKAQNMDFDSFQSSFLPKIKAIQEKHSGRDVTFKVVVSEGKVSLKAGLK